MKRLRRRGRVRKRVRIGAPDPSLTGTSGVAAVAEFVEVLDVVGRFDRGVGSIKKRDRGASAGELLVGMAQSQGMIGLSLISTALGFCCDVLFVKARTFAFSDRIGRVPMKV